MLFFILSSPHWFFLFVFNDPPRHSTQYLPLPKLPKHERHSYVPLPAKRFYIHCFSDAAGATSGIIHTHRSLISHGKFLLNLMLVALKYGSHAEIICSGALCLHCTVPPFLLTSESFWVPEVSPRALPASISFVPNRTPAAFALFHNLYMIVIISGTW